MRYASRWSALHEGKTKCATRKNIQSTPVGQRESISSKKIGRMTWTR